MEFADTIAAISTPPGEGGIAIVRLSGDRAGQILSSAFRPQNRQSVLSSHRLYYGHALSPNGEVLDEVMAVIMRAPNSYTREDVAEIHCHGGRVSADRVLRAVFDLGARPAQPGEFTRRAFLNGRLDLAGAEAVMQLIHANGEMAARASVRQLEGGVSRFVRATAEKLTDLLSHIEASDDFPEEVEEQAAREEVLSGIGEILRDIDRRLDARGARILREGASIVLAGRPNVGKSSLMNAFLQQERAIVTEIPGTTRDVLTERVLFDGVLAEISDTAGIRRTDDPVEKIGVTRAKEALDRADVVLLVLDASQTLTDEDRTLLAGADERFLLCLNKNDLAPSEDFGQFRRENAFSISARTGQGMDALMEAIRARIVPAEGCEDLLVSQRHIQLARQAMESLSSAREAILSGLPLDLSAVDLSCGLEKLCEITGENATESVIDAVFRNFCVGK